jgi:hypothetical protein
MAAAVAASAAAVAAAVALDFAAAAREVLAAAPALEAFVVAVLEALVAAITAGETTGFAAAFAFPWKPSLTLDRAYRTTANTSACTTTCSSPVFSDMKIFLPIGGRVTRNPGCSSKKSITVTASIYIEKGIFRTVTYDKHTQQY